MSRCVYKVEFISFPLHSCGRQFDGNTTFLFDIHRIHVKRLWNVISARLGSDRGDARGLRGGTVRTPGRGAGTDHAAGAAALPELP